MQSTPAPPPTRWLPRSARVIAAAFSIAVAAAALAVVVAGMASLGDSRARGLTSYAPLGPAASTTTSPPGTDAPAPVGTLPSGAAPARPVSPGAANATTPGPAGGQTAPAPSVAPVTVPRSGDLMLLEPWFGGPPASVAASQESFIHDELEFSTHVGAIGDAPLTDARLWVDGYVAKDGEAGVEWERRDVGGVQAYTTVSVAEEGVNVRTTVAAPSPERLVVVCTTWLGATAPPDAGLLEAMLTRP